VDILPTAVIEERLDGEIEAWLDRDAWERRDAEIEAARALLHATVGQLSVEQCAALGAIAMKTAFKIGFA
jgi:hypothetical protein